MRMNGHMPFNNPGQFHNPNNVNNMTEQVKNLNNIMNNAYKRQLEAMLQKYPLSSHKSNLQRQWISSMNASWTLYQVMQASNWKSKLQGHRGRLSFYSSLRKCLIVFRTRPSKCSIPASVLKLQQHAKRSKSTEQEWLIQEEIIRVADSGE